MSSHTNDILTELSPLLSDKGEYERLREITSLLSSHKPKISLDARFRDNLRKRILEIKREKKKTVYHFSWYRFFPIFGTAFACMLFGVSFWKLFFSNDLEIREKVSPPMSMTESIPSPENLTPAVQRVAEKKVEEFRAEKSSIDSEIQDIVNDMDILGTQGDRSSRVPITPSLTVGGGSPVSPSIGANNMISTNTPPLSSDMTMPMTLAKSSGVDLAPYPSTMRLYAKADAWTNEDISTRSGTGLIIRDLPTEKISLIRTKAEKLLEGRTLLSSKIEYQVMEKIAINKEKLSYLVPVMILTTESGEKIKFSLIRGFR